MVGRKLPKADIDSVYSKYMEDASSRHEPITAVKSDLNAVIAAMDADLDAIGLTFDFRGLTETEAYRILILLLEARL